MRKLIILFVFCLFVLVVASPAEAHSGRTDSNGGHNCNVGACAGTYHYHNGGPAVQPQTQAVQEVPVYVPPTNAPVERVVVATAIPTRKPTNIPPTKAPTRIPTKKPTAKPTTRPTKIVTPTVTETPIATSTPTMKKAQPAQRAIDTQMENEKGFWYRFFSFLTGK